MYDDDDLEVAAPASRNSSSGPTSYHPARFPTKNISSPVVLMYGDVDSLVDIDMMVKELPVGGVVAHRLHVRLITRSLCFHDV
jgi:lysosomal acid lipase/cholesteryl ester hydrolase